MMRKTVLISMLTTRGAVDAGRRKERPQVASHDQPPSHAGGRGGIPRALLAFLATRDVIEITLDDQRPLFESPD